MLNRLPFAYVEKETSQIRRMCSKSNSFANVTRGWDLQCSSNLTKRCASSATSLAKPAPVGRWLYNTYVAAPPPPLRRPLLMAAPMVVGMY